jgi:hypothetical protein
MNRALKRRVALGLAAAVAVGAAGGAIAATQLGSPREESQAVVDDAAAQLGVEPSKLSAALRKALENRVDAAVAAGRLSKEEGDALKARIESGDVPLFGFGARHGSFGHRHGPFAAELDGAASYLGLTRGQLRAELRGGKSLAQVAGAHGKSVDGLVDALVDRVKERLDAGVAAGRLTKAERDQALKGLRARLTDLVNLRFPPRFVRPRFRFGFGRPDLHFARPHVWVWPPRDS